MENPSRRKILEFLHSDRITEELVEEFHSEHRLFNELLDLLEEDVVVRRESEGDVVWSKK